MKPKQRIVILFGEDDRKRARGYVIHYLAEIWRSLGIHVEYLFGADRFVPADIAIVHVDLSVVPDKFLELARKYPAAINGDVKDIRKTQYSELQLESAEDYHGQVIVKSNFNYGGIPESRGFNKLLRKISRKVFAGSPRFGAYRVFDKFIDVPERYLDNDEFIVEKFLPERVGDLYAVRNFHFLGDSSSCTRMFSLQPVISGRTSTRIDHIDTHSKMFEIRRNLKIDYGKIDFVVHQDKPIVLDVNKTVGFGGLAYDNNLKALHRKRAMGIYCYFP